MLLHLIDNACRINGQKLYSEVSNDALDCAVSRDMLWLVIAQSILFYVW